MATRWSPARVKELRRKAQLTQEAAAAKIGVTFSTWNRWENGKVTVSKLAGMALDQLASTVGYRGAA